MIDFVLWVAWRKRAVIVSNPLLWKTNIKSLFFTDYKNINMLNSTGGLKGTVRESIIWKVMYGFGLCLDLDCQWGLYSGHLLSLECRGFTLFLIFTMKGPMARYKLCAFVAEIRHLAQICALMKQNYFHKLWITTIYIRTNWLLWSFFFYSS